MEKVMEEVKEMDHEVSREPDHTPPHHPHHSPPPASRRRKVIIAVAVLLIGGLLVGLGVVPLGRGLRLLAKRVASARPHAAAGPGGGPHAVSPEPVRSAMDDGDEGKPPGT